MLGKSDLISSMVCFGLVASIGMTSSVLPPARVPATLGRAASST